MNIGDLITIAISVIGSGGIVAWYNARNNAKRGKAQTETEARAQKTDEFAALTGAQDRQLSRMQNQLDALERKVTVISAQHQSAEDYIDLLMEGIYNGTIPPIPARTKIP